MQKKVRADRYTACLSVIMIGTMASCLFSQVSPLGQSDGNAAFLQFVRSLGVSTCIEDVPAPTLRQEPRYTQGTRNKICFQLPPAEALPFSPDSVKTPFVLTFVRDSRSNALLEFPRPVALADQTLQLEVIGSLRQHVRYDYSTALFLPRCTVSCDAVVDSSQLELHCSAFRDSVWSIQDSEAPEVEQFKIPQLEGSLVRGWLSSDQFTVEARASDAAGVWQAFLYRRQCSENEWGQPVADSTLDSEMTDQGYLFAETADLRFSQDLPDGCYQLRIEARDATHTPESCFPNFELAGNEGDPEPGAAAQQEIRLDTTAPDSVKLSCQQVLSTIELSWTPAEDAPIGIGLAGYRILRDQNIIATVPAGQTAYVDGFSADHPDQTFTYRIEPFDSLLNVQELGGEAACQFRAQTLLTMRPEPRFTLGSQNQVCWSAAANLPPFQAFSAISDSLNSPFSVAVTDTCFSFENLRDGATYLYWVEAIDAQQRAVRSDTVASTQDATRPEILRFEIDGLIELGGRNWLTERDVRASVELRDAGPGVLGTLLLLENNSPAGAYDLAGVSSLDTALVLALTTEPCRLISLSAQVTDRAGNVSPTITRRFYLDSEPPAQVTDLSCVQLPGRNAVGLSWSPVLDRPGCSGLAGYQIWRDEELLATVAPGASSYTDTFAQNTPTSRFSYRVSPVDSVGNLQTEGGRQFCDYIGITQIVLQPLPEFIPGLSSTVCWNISATLPSVTLFSDTGCDGSVEDSLSFAGIQTQNCHTFDNLRDGQSYCYWMAAQDEQGRVVASDTVVSIQDNTPPVIQEFSLAKAEVLGDQIWTFSRDIELAVRASDQPPGEIWGYRILEGGLEATSGTFVDSAASVATRLGYRIQGPAGQSAAIGLQIEMLDGAGNASVPVPLTLFLQERERQLFAFPNPFNPMSEKVTIRLDDPAETELRIYDFFGNLVRVIRAKANSHDFQWDGRNGNGEYVASGGYICIGTQTKARFKIGVLKKSS